MPFPAFLFWLPSCFPPSARLPSSVILLPGFQGAKKYVWCELGVREREKNRSRGLRRQIWVGGGRLGFEEAELKDLPSPAAFPSSHTPQTPWGMCRLCPAASTEPEIKPRPHLGPPRPSKVSFVPPPGTDNPGFNFILLNIGAFQIQVSISESQNPPLLQNPASHRTVKVGKAL